MDVVPSSGRRTLVTGGSGFIGMNLVRRLSETGREVLNVSRRRPADHGQPSAFAPVDVLDLATLRETVQRFAPTEVVHLAARTDFVERDDRSRYDINTRGTANVIAAVASLDTSVRCAFASTNIVRADDIAPEGGVVRLDYRSSKEVAEQIIARDTTLRGAWCIVRPCYVWGPWFGPPFRQLFQAVGRQRYFQLGTVNPPKLLGYVGNVVHQIVALLDAPDVQIDRRTFYLADYAPTTIQAWADQIAREMGVRRPRRLPEPAVQLAAHAGDLLRAVRYRHPPLTTARLANMRRDTSGTPTDAIRSVVSSLPFTMEQGVAETVRWMRQLERSTSAGPER